MTGPAPRAARASYGASLDTPASSIITDAGSPARVLEVLHQYWGYDALRPMQGEAIAAGLARRDSLVVMPTGGGKSLCYQIPAVLASGLTLVVSPLIALMQDQVQGLELSGYPAAALHSHVEPEQAASTRRRVDAGELKLLYASPERLLAPGFLSWMARLHDRGQLSALAIDEAHCISQWGHDFRPEYRRLAEVRDALPRLPFHAFTATATPRVREDICAQLRLREPSVLVGRFDRPNLTYRVQPRTDLVQQCARVLRAHAGRAAIIYCISRKDTEELAEDLTRLNIPAKAYHAGLDKRTRERVQDDFIDERLNVVVATVAFGMGIDRGDVRCVIHAALPKTIEHYQQETGRAGRDGLPSECVLFTSPADAPRWLRLMERSANDSQADPESIAQGLRVQKDLLRQVQALVGSARCRHRALTEYFGQEYQPPSRTSLGPDVAMDAASESARGCGACDVCLGDLVPVPDSSTIARKILSCVYRVGERYGAAHVADVLRGSRSAKLADKGHDKLSTFGLLASMPREAIVGHIQQLVDAGLLAVDGAEYPVLRLTAHAAPVLRGEREFTFHATRLEEPARARAASGALAAGAGLSPPERELFEVLRALRRRIAEEKGVPPYLVFGDVTLEELARLRPALPEAMLGVRGIGAIKLRDFGTAFAAEIAAFCTAKGLSTMSQQSTHAPRSRRERAAANAAVVGERPRPRVRPAEAALFEAGTPLEELAATLTLSVGTVSEHLCAWIEATKPASVRPWVDDATFARVEAALDEVGGSHLRPIWDRLEGQVPYEQIRIVIAKLRAG